MTSAPSGASVEGAPAAAARPARLEATIFVGLLIAFGVATFVVTLTMPQTGTATWLATRAMPYGASLMMIVSGVAIFIQQLRGTYGKAEDAEDVDTTRGTSWVPVIVLIAATASLIFTIPLLGWPIGVAILFSTSAIVLGAARWQVAVLTGVLLGVITQLLFGNLMGLSLPWTGTLTEWIGL